MEQIQKHLAKYIAEFNICCPRCCNIVQFYYQGKNANQCIKLDFIKGFSQKTAKTKQSNSATWFSFTMKERIPVSG